MTTAACLVVQLAPVAPPRLLARLGFADTGLQYGQSVYGSLSTGLGNQLSAMPSLHIGWAVIVAWAVVSVSHSPWRGLAGVHLVVMNLVVVATANHWWLDGVVATAIVAAVVGALPALGLVARRLGAALEWTAGAEPAAPSVTPPAATYGAT